MARRGFKAPGNYEPKRAGKFAKKSRQSKATKQSKETKRADVPKRQDASKSSKPSSNGGQVDRLPVLAAPLPGPLEATQTTPEDVAGLQFEDLGLGGNIVRALAELGATKPFAIQAATIPDAIAGHHVLGRARTGSGKTIAFGAAVVERMLRLKAEGAFGPPAPKREAKRGERQERRDAQPIRAPKALILAPTRELALQIDRTVQAIARSVGLYTGQFVGGQPFEPQLHALRRGVDIAIGTPGRIEDLVRRGHLSLGHVGITVIDEADHMAELGFVEAVQWVLRQTRRGGQRLLFSATLDRGVDGLVREFMPRPAIHEIIETSGARRTDGGGDRALASHPSGDAQQRAGAEFDWAPQPNVEHRVLIVLREHKDQALVQLVREGGRVVVFCRTRAYAEQVTELLDAAGVRATPLHGNLSQIRRERNLEAFTSGKVGVLVATDVAARGIHVDDIDLVLQADPPDDPKAYVHRAGRTGRVGRAGRVLTLIPRTRQKRTRELFEQLGFEPAFFGDFLPQGAS